jgi:ribosomal protein L16/L10AE
MGIFTVYQIRFEFVYLRVFKKLFRKKYFKKKPIFLPTKFWLMVKPNFLLTMKSKNSRMGSGVGLYVRVCSVMKPNKPVLLLKHYSINFIKKVLKYLKKKNKYKFLFT